jgi:hypothetical protein
MFAMFLHVLPSGVSAILCLVVLVGFWRGLTLPPHKDGHRPRRGIHWWYGPRD